MSDNSAQNAELTMTDQVYSEDPLADRRTDHYRNEYVKTFVDKWDELIDWRAEVLQALVPDPEEVKVS